MIENLYRNINSKLSLILFGNPNRLNYNIFNLFYKIAISKNDIKSEKIYNLKKKGYFKASEASKELVDLINENIINKNQIDNELTEKLHSNKAKTNSDEKKSISYKIDTSIRQKILNFIQEDFKDDISVLEKYYNNKIAVAEVQVKRNYPLDNKEYYNQKIRSKEFEYYSNYYHVDFYVNTHLKLFVNLQDVTKEDGPLHIYSKTSTGNFIKKNKYKNRNNYLANEIETELYVNSSKKRESFFANTTECLHRAGDLKNGHHRDMLFISFIVIPEKVKNENKSSIDFYNNIYPDSLWIHDSRVTKKTKPNSLKDVYSLFKNYYTSKIN